jgi:hypothetical protein
VEDSGKLRENPIELELEENPRQKTNEKRKIKERLRLMTRLCWCVYVFIGYSVNPFPPIAFLKDNFG